MADMGRENKKTFDQRNRKHADYDHWNLFEYLPQDAGNEEHGEKRHHVGQYAEGNRHGDFFGSRNSGFQPRNTALIVMIDVFPDHDGIIHHDAEGDDKREHGDHVNTDVHGR